MLVEYPLKVSCAFENQNYFIGPGKTSVVELGFFVLVSWAFGKFEF